MDTIVNAHQFDAWNGYEGRHWADHQDRYDAVNHGFNEPLLRAAAIGAAERVLDIGCGCGQTTRLAAGQAVRGAAVGVDLSWPMLARARRTAERDNVGNVTFEQGDAQVHPFPGGGFDVAISRFGIMFFTDPVAGFGNIMRALRPGGRIAFLSLRAIDDSEIGGVLAAIRPHLRTHADADAVQDDGAGPDLEDAGPDSLADPARIRAILD
ncbi:MAG: class I SAM-dependent methyltransferase, partial [Micromonosporaceae bacterium]